MLLIALLIQILKLINSLEEADQTKILKKCFSSLKYSVKNISFVEVPDYCKLMRADAIQCLVKQMNYPTSGDLISRAEAFSTISKRMNSTYVMEHAKFFNHACVQSDWAQWTDEECFRKMINQCIIDIMSPCQQVECQRTTQAPKDEEGPSAKSGNNFLSVPMLLITLSTYDYVP